MRLADTAPDAALMKDVIRKLNPQREDWFRMQRALLEVVPRDHVVEGPIRLALLPDRLQGSPPAFALRTPEGAAIQLVPNDGCGFIRESLACRIPVIRQAMHSAQAQALEGESQRMSLLPPQATHHFPRDQATIEEARTHLRASLRDDPELWVANPADGTRDIKTHKLYEALAGALIMGTQGIAVPSGDDRLHLPRDKSKVFDATGGTVLLGKPLTTRPTSCRSRPTASAPATTATPRPGSWTPPSRSSTATPPGTRPATRRPPPTTSRCCTARA